jgi:hypothetical protein
MRRVVSVEGCNTKIIDNPHPTPPEQLYAVLFKELCQVDASQITITAEERIPREGFWAEGYFGTEQAGVRWIESGATIAPMDVQHTSYGLPGMELRWRYQRHKAGQGAYSDYQHRDLEITFDDDAAVAQFTTIWQLVFGQPPLLEDKTEESDE